MKTCDSCGNKLNKDEDFVDESGDRICDECYTEHYMELCPVCEEYYDKPQTPNDCYFAITKSGEEETGTKRGIYQANKYPVFSDSLFGGMCRIEEDNVRLLRECDVDEMSFKLWGSRTELKGGEFICPKCAEHFARKNNFLSIRRLWTTNALHKNIFERGVIQNGY